MTSTTQEKIDTWTKLAGLVFIIISGAYALWQYSYAQEREFQKAFYAKQLDVVMEVFDTLSALDAAATEQDKKAVAAKFWLIYHGKARTFLDPKMFEKLQLPADYVSVCIMKVMPAKPFDCSKWSTSMTAPGFAIVAREQLSRAWNRSLSDLAEEDPWATAN